MKRRIISLSMVLFLLMASLNMYIPVYSATSSDLTKLYDDLKALEKKQTAMEKERADALKQKKNEVANKNNLDKEISNTETQIKTLNDIIKGIETDLDKKNDELDTANKEMDDYYKLYKERIRANFEADQTTYLEVLLGSKSFSDLIVRLDMVSQIVEYDQRLLGEMKQKIAHIEEIRNGIAEKKKENDEAKSKMKVQQTSLKTKSTESLKLIKDLESDIKEYEKLLDKIEAEANTLNTQISKLTNKNTKYVGGKLEWPTPNYYNISSPFGWRIHPITKTKRFHYGIDISGGGIHGSKVLAANDGVVIFAGYTTYEGNVISVDHGGGITTQYKHLSAMYVGVGASVKRGASIGAVGSTGIYSTGAHLHYEVSENGTRVNPMKYYS